MWQLWGLETLGGLVCQVGLGDPLHRGMAGVLGVWDCRCEAAGGKPGRGVTGPCL